MATELAQLSRHVAAAPAVKPESIRVMKGKTGTRFDVIRMNDLFVVSLYIFASEKQLSARNDPIITITFSQRHALGQVFVFEVSKM